MAHLKATFEVTSWDEQAFDGDDRLPKLTRASVAKRYTGDIDGTSVTEWLMSYRPDDTATFVGLERVHGRITIDAGTREGTVVLQHVGDFENGAATAALTVVEGSGSGELTNVRGAGTFRADPDGAVTLTLDE